MNKLKVNVTFIRSPIFLSAKQIASALVNLGDKLDNFFPYFFLIRVSVLEHLPDDIDTDQ